MYDESVTPASESNPRVDDPAFDNPQHENLPTSAANDAIVPVEASEVITTARVMDPYPAIPSALRDDPRGPVPMDTNTNPSAELEAYPTTLFMESSGTAHDFLNDAELGLDFGMNDIFANLDPYSYDFGTTSDDTNILPLLCMPLVSPPPRMATPDALPDPDVPLKAAKKRRNPSVDPANMIDGTRCRFKSH
ncbi:hypothetical protein B0H13DRAFT_1882438 [Mycena leptocephala]|nr:hypothetical protein B0H13DRAFT_1882438 [Mycena leptocephala]